MEPFLITSAFFSLTPLLLLQAVLLRMVRGLGPVSMVKRWRAERTKCSSQSISSMKSA